MQRLRNLHHRQVPHQRSHKHLQKALIAFRSRKTWWHFSHRLSQHPWAKAVKAIVSSSKPVVRFFDPDLLALDSYDNLETLARTLDSFRVRTHWSDIHNMLDQFPRGLSPPARDRAKAFMESKKLHSFLGVGRHSRLLVVGPDRKFKDDWALSFVCGKLVSELNRQHRSTTWVIFWFCRSNTIPLVDENLSEMMIGLIQQLLVRITNHIKEGSSPHLYLDTSSIPCLKISERYYPQPDVLQAIFQDLVKLVPANGITLFCILDGLSHYQHERRKALASLMEFMSRFCGPENEGVAFKLLMTAPQGLRLLKGLCDIRPDMEAPEDAFDFQWNEGIGEQVKSL